MYKRILLILFFLCYLFNIFYLSYANDLDSLDSINNTVLKKYDLKKDIYVQFVLDIDSLFEEI
ncbi:MAG: hypothetical protein LBF97_08370 [Elusimicrobiota bacterium]|jgi:hypothetical protein|nr:hypothetical protein [Elusimicrobiota bacterium]